MDWYPHYPIDYSGDTMHLSLAGHGAYRLLIDRYMLTEKPLPDDDAILAKIILCDRAEWLAVADEVRAFFTARDGLLNHKRCDQELRVQKNRKKRKSAAGRKGAAARHEKKEQPPKKQEATIDSETNDLSGSRTTGAEKNLPTALADAEHVSATGQDRTVVTPKSMSNAGVTSGPTSEAQTSGCARENSGNGSAADPPQARQGQSNGGSSPATDGQQRPPNARNEEGSQAERSKPPGWETKHALDIPEALGSKRSTA